MTDPLRSGRPPSSPEVPDRDRDARVEELLLTGLDHYFSGQHDLAVNVWTRVLFLDRGHARARAYIERARSAIAERQREGEELLHTGVAAFKRGDQAAARALLRSAVDRGAGGEEAMALLQRLDRLEAAAQHVESGVPHARTTRDAATVPDVAAANNRADLDRDRRDFRSSPRRTDLAVGRRSGNRVARHGPRCTHGRAGTRRRTASRCPPRPSCRLLALERCMRVDTCAMRWSRSNRSGTATGSAPRRMNCVQPSSKNCSPREGPGSPRGMRRRLRVLSKYPADEMPEVPVHQFRERRALP